MVKSLRKKEPDHVKTVIGSDKTLVITSMTCNFSSDLTRTNPSERSLQSLFLQNKVSIVFYTIANCTLQKGLIAVLQYPISKKNREGAEPNSTNVLFVYYQKGNPNESQ